MKFIKWLQEVWNKYFGKKPDSSIPKPIKLPHGEHCHVPADHVDGEAQHSFPPFASIRLLELGDDVFLKKFALDHVYVKDGYVVSDDFEKDNVVYVWEVFNVGTYSDQTKTNPLKVEGLDMGAFRCRWRSYEKAV